MKRASVKTFLVWLLITFLVPAAVQAQNITGIWRGYFHTMYGEEYKFELQIAQTKAYRISGVSYSYLDTRFYGKATLTGAYNKVGQSALIQEIKTVEVKMSGGMACIMKCSFTYSRSGNEEFLDGTFTSTVEKTDSASGQRKGDNCGGGSVHLRKVITSDFYIEPFLKNKIKPAPATTKPVAKAPVNTPAPGKTTPVVKKPVAPVKKPATTIKKPVTAVKKPVTQPVIDTVRKLAPVGVDEPKPKPKISVPAITRSRSNELVKTFTVSDDEVTVKFYDNGEVDNDTISVYLDGKPLALNQRLSTVPIILKIKMEESNPEHTLVMVAENMGRIPPNTSLMIVQDGDKRYEASITSTEQKNAMVRFRYQKKEN